MKLSGWISVTFLASSALSIETIPFSSPLAAESNRRAYDVLQFLKRSGNCPGEYNPCSNMGNSDVCCKANAICTSDEANHIACCPTGVSCTGSLSGTSTQTGTGSFQFPHSDATTTSDSNGATITGSTLAGAYPFLYVPTTFSNADVCSSYYTRCESDYTQCITQLGGGYGVTVTGGGADVTRAGGADGAVATCSSLSLEACHGLNLGYCDSYQGGDSNMGVPGRTSSFQDLVFGLVIGVAGLFI